MPAGSKRHPPLAKAKPISASVITYLRSRKTLRERAFAAGERSEKIIHAYYVQSGACQYKKDVPKWRSVTSSVPRGLVLGLGLFNIFVSDMDSGIEVTLSKFANNTKLCCAVDTLEGRDAIQRDLDRLVRWACVNCMKFNKAMFKVLHVGCCNPKHHHSLGGEGMETSPEEKDLEVLADEKLNMSQRCAHAAQKAN
ncbi:cAMP-dependent protein kinase inhibitor alpha [Grus japonensis]|uniref:cAMP-dependent protein kinase inhibitor alpha n=1 Tax=Grus japonensis TaxID=30415 RepID=A0ABC9W0G0_GRUJA